MYHVNDVIMPIIFFFLLWSVIPHPPTLWRKKGGGGRGGGGAIRILPKKSWRSKFLCIDKLMWPDPIFWKCFMFSSSFYFAHQALFLVFPHPPTLWKHPLKIKWCLLHIDTSGSRTTPTQMTPHQDNSCPGLLPTRSPGQFPTGQLPTRMTLH